MAAEWDWRLVCSRLRLCDDEPEDDFFVEDAHFVLELSLELRLPGLQLFVTGFQRRKSALQISVTRIGPRDMRRAKALPATAANWAQSRELCAETAYVLPGLPGNKDNFWIANRQLDRVTGLRE